MFGLILFLVLGAPVAVTLAVAGTMARADHPSGGHDPRCGVRLILGVVAYPAASILVLHGLSGSAIDAVSITVFGLPGLALGALVRRIWIVGVPPAGAVIWLLVAYAMDPSCTNCGSDDTWTVLVLMTMIYLVIPAMLSLLLGILVGNLLSRFTSPRRAARSQRAAAKRSLTPDVTHGVQRVSRSVSVAGAERSSVIGCAVGGNGGARMVLEGHLWPLGFPEAAFQGASTVAEDRFAM
ncbi:MAG: hypothetical protein M3Y09_01175 [Actinomycetota bacterium]|nr:hypothetical protein [Actinomycetota bacterium]